MQEHLVGILPPVQVSGAGDCSTGVTFSHVAQHWPSTITAFSVFGSQTVQAFGFSTNLLSRQTYSVQALLLDGAVSPGFKIAGVADCATSVMTHLQSAALTHLTPSKTSSPGQSHPV